MRADVIGAVVLVGLTIIVSLACAGIVQVAGAAGVTAELKSVASSSVWVRRGVDVGRAVLATALLCASALLNFSVLGTVYLCGWLCLVGWGAPADRAVSNAPRRAAVATVLGWCLFLVHAIALTFLSASPSEAASALLIALGLVPRQLLAQVACCCGLAVLLSLHFRASRVAARRRGGRGGGHRAAAPVNFEGAGDSLILDDRDNTDGTRGGRGGDEDAGGVREDAGAALLSSGLASSSASASASSSYVYPDWEDWWMQHPLLFAASARAWYVATFVWITVQPSFVGVLLLPAATWGILLELRSRRHRQLVSCVFVALCVLLVCEYATPAIVFLTVGSTLDDYKIGVLTALGLLGQRADTLAHNESGIDISKTQWLDMLCEDRSFLILCHALVIVAVGLSERALRSLNKGGFDDNGGQGEHGGHSGYRGWHPPGVGGDEDGAGGETKETELAPFSSTTSSGGASGGASGSGGDRPAASSDALELATIRDFARLAAFDYGRKGLVGLLLSGPKQRVEDI
jgi:hypothetical protein